MRIKFVPVIAFLLVFSVTIVSCLGDNDPGEYSPDATIKSFALDTIYYNYTPKFTIDQLSNPARIYNVDSIPHSADTIINKILVKDLRTGPYAVVVIGDSMYMNTTDSLDFTTTMDSPMKITVYAQDVAYKKDYTIQVRRHKQDPDSLSWSKIETSFLGDAFKDSKTVVLGNQLLVYTSNTTVYSTSVDDGKNWRINTGIQGLPSNIKLHSLFKHTDINNDEHLYIINEGGTLFHSADGIEWKDSPLEGKVISLLASIPRRDRDHELTPIISAVIEKDGKNVFAVTDIESGVWETGEEVPANFPIDNISYITHTNATALIRSVIVGKPADASETQTVPWFTLMDGRMDGKVWSDMATEGEYHLPAFVNPTIMYYGDKFYAFGDGFETIYTSGDNGFRWKKIEEKFMFPDDFKNRMSYSMAIDSKNFIWMIWNYQPLGSAWHGNEVWRGRLNRLGFDIQ